jgi:hypothetical protein
MTESVLSYEPEYTVKQWRCSKCTHVLGDVVNGKCAPLHRVVLTYNLPAVVICPICKHEEPWYSGYDKRPDLQY